MFQLPSFPAISAADFETACRAFEQRCYDRLDGSDWLSVRWDRSGELGSLSIKKAVQVEKPEGGSGTDEEMNGDRIGDEDAFQDGDYEEDARAMEIESTTAVKRPSQTVLHMTTVTADFSVTLSPTYQVPMLWFTLFPLPRKHMQSIDIVYRYLVPSQLHNPLREMGVTGGISVGYHPISDVPAFFIHPCKTGDALRALGSVKLETPEQYLFLWLGLVGPVVGLYIPSKLLACGN